MRNAINYTCSACGKTKPRSEYTTDNRNKKRGVTYSCKACNNAFQLTSKKKNREHYRTYIREYMRARRGSVRRYTRA